MHTLETIKATVHRPIADDLRAVARLTSVPTILQAVAHATGMRFTVVARVTDSHWTACAVYDQIDFGMEPGSELVLESTLCNEVRQHHQTVVFNEATKHPYYRDHPTPKMYGFESYISLPIFLENGAFFGTLCALDPLPAKLDDQNVVKTLELFARLIGAELDAQERIEQSTHALLDAQQTAKLREQFIAVLGHDLRNPLMAIQSGVEVLKLKPLDAKSHVILEHMQRSGDRMGGLIDDVLDFARGRLGGGIPVALQRQDDLATELRHVIAEVQQANVGRAMEVTVAIGYPVVCDPRRIAQLLANLVSNALTHGDADQPVRVTAQSDAEAFELAVSNAGQPIPEAKLARLFQPFTRGDDEEISSGLGLGLYIASEIARAHGGSLEVSSTAQETRFVFRMPVQCELAAPTELASHGRDPSPLAC